MTDINKLIGQLVNNGAAGGFAGGLAGGIASNSLTSKSGRKLGKKALKLGGVAAVATLAYTAYQRYNKNSDSTVRTVPAVSADNSTSNLISLPPDSAFMPEENNNSANEALGVTLLRAMIAAARADGRLDAEESQIIFQRIQTLGLDTESQALLVKEMGQSVDVDAIINSANTIEIAAEIYIASLLAIKVDNDAEKNYMGMLAARLQLPRELVAELEQQIEAQKIFV